MVSRMSSLRILNDETFDTKRPQYKEGDDDLMTVTYVTSDWTKTPEPQTEPQVQPTKQKPTPKPEPEKKPEA